MAPSEPLRTFLDRNLSIARAREVIDLAGPILEEIVNFSTNAIARCSNERGFEGSEHLPLIALYRHQIEVTDALAELCRTCCTEAMPPLLRSSFETLLSIEYMVEQPAEHKQRALSWLYYYYRNGVKSCDRLNPATSIGKDFQQLREADKILKGVEFQHEQALIAEREWFLAKIEEAELGPIRDEASRTKPRHWYSLFNGPRDLCQLAIRLNLGAMYHVLYPEWSRVSHAETMRDLLMQGESGRTYLRGIRDPKRLKFYAPYGALFLFDGTQLVLAHFRPGEDFTWWRVSVARRIRRFTEAPDLE